MKNRRFALFVLVLALYCCSVPAPAQELVFSGTVVGMSADTGTLILSNGPNVKVTLAGLHQARIRAVDGRVVALGRLRPGMRVSVAYLPQGRGWVVSRVLVASEAHPELVPLITDRRYRTLFDGDITTNPGSKAAVDGDITTKPARSANRDGDITTKADR
ncbi:MAG: hypothetical protein QOE70_1816 [Chthoniobacter sp.]|jgi:hypothetical protein|nr:hypothetical protein [Chthoniobacter sp.]